MDAKKLYGGVGMEMDMPMQNKYVSPSVSFSYNPKERQEPIPMDAIIKKVDKSVSIREIDNGYIKRTCTSTYYEVAEKEDGEKEMEQKYHYEENETYYKEKPMDILKLYV